MTKIQNPTYYLPPKGVYGFSLLSAETTNMELDSDRYPVLVLTLEITHTHETLVRFIGDQFVMRFKIWGGMTKHPKSNLVMCDKFSSTEKLRSKAKEHANKLGRIAKANGYAKQLPSNSSDYVGMQFCAIIDYYAKKEKALGEILFQIFPLEGFTSIEEFDIMCSSNEKLIDGSQVESKLGKDSEGNMIRYCSYYFGSVL